ncbi:MAG: tetratricopeptide repeat protein [Elusimicrobia bacterium]|nr:tetratricopeptide repeat protein [Elusimicrobiota bacterium]
MKKYIYLLSAVCYLLSVSCLSGQESLKDIYDTCEKQFQNGDYESVITSADVIISSITKLSKKERSGNSSLLRKTYLLKADSLSEALKLDLALKDYWNTIEKFPKTQEALKAKLGVGLVYYKKNYYEKTRRYFLDFMKKYPYTIYTDNAQYWLGMLHFKNKSYKKAVISFKNLINKYPKSDYSAEGWLRLGDSYYALKNYKKARDAWRGLLKRYPKDKEAEFALYNIGRAYESLGSISYAISIYAEFAEKYPKSIISPEVTYQVAEYFYKKKDYEKAVKYFEQFFTNFPDHSLSENARFVRSKIFYKRGDNNAALNSFNEFIESYPESQKQAEALLYIGNCYFDSADYQKAIENYKKGLEGEPASADITAMLKYNCGQAYEAVGYSSEAENCYAEILFRYPKSLAAAKMYLKRGMDLERSGDYFAAIENYELAANISKNKSIQKKERLITGVDDNVGPLAQKKAADCYFMQKKFKEASREYLKVVYLFNDSEYVPESHYMAARASEEIGYIKEAKRNYSIVEKKYKDTDWAKKSSERLQELAKK